MGRRVSRSPGGSAGGMPGEAFRRQSGRSRLFRRSIGSFLMLPVLYIVIISLTLEHNIYK